MRALCVRRACVSVYRPRTIHYPSRFSAVEAKTTGGAHGVAQPPAARRPRVTKSAGAGISVSCCVVVASLIPALEGSPYWQAAMLK
jgi:hypothetical protein